MAGNITDSNTWWKPPDTPVVNPLVNTGAGGGGNFGSGGSAGIKVGGGGGGIGPSSPSLGDPGLFAGAAKQQASDYDSIMAGYKNLGNINIIPQTVDYQPSDFQQQALGNLSDLSKTGGYSDQGIQDIRERSISPIRSIYSSAQQDLQRQKSLQGGYSPSSAAASTRMARDLSSKVGDITTNVNAGIAQNVAQNKLSIAPSFAGASQAESNARMQAESHNADIINAINEFNAGLKQSSLEGMKGLYGTTPALAQLFGSQALQSRSLDQNQQQINSSSQQGIMRLLMSLVGES